MNISELTNDLDRMLAGLKSDFDGLTLREKVLRLVAILPGYPQP
jgi:hypothetical protein